MQVILLQVPLEVAWTATVSWEAGDLVCRVMVFLRSVQTLLRFLWFINFVFSCSNVALVKKYQDIYSIILFR